MDTVLSGDCYLNVRVDGPADGAAVMLCNSLGTDLRVWDPMLPHLPAGMRVIRYDKRGHGLSDCPDGPYTIPMLGQDAAAIADAVGAKDIIFVGLSIGGLIGQQLAHDRPELLKGLALMDTAAKIGNHEIWNERIAMVRSAGLPSMADGVMDRWFSAAGRKDTAKLAPWKNMLSATRGEGYAACSEAIMNADFTPQVDALKLPIIAMAGEEDNATTPELVKATADLYGAPFHLIAGAGHLPCVEAPEATGKIVSDFIRSLNG